MISHRPVIQIFSICRNTPGFILKYVRYIKFSSSALFILGNRYRELLISHTIRQTSISSSYIISNSGSLHITSDVESVFTSHNSHANHFVVFLFKFITQKFKALRYRPYAQNQTSIMLTKHLGTVSTFLNASHHDISHTFEVARFVLRMLWNSNGDSTALMPQHMWNSKRCGKSNEQSDDKILQ